jgi:hypothetical protein
MKPGELDGKNSTESGQGDTARVSDEFAAFLGDVRETTAFQDSEGKLLGVFRPATDLEKRFNQPGLHTTAEVFEYFRTLTNDPALLADLDRHIEELKRRDEDACPAR